MKKRILFFTAWMMMITGAKVIDDYDSSVHRWSRQSGKSHMISAKLLHTGLLHPGWQMGVVGPDSIGFNSQLGSAYADGRVGGPPPVPPV